MKLFIHIGPHKTGSTSIQRFLSGNRAFLRTKGLLYPSYSLHDDQHFLLPLKFLNQNLFYKSLKDETDRITVQGLIDYICQNNKKINIISSEMFSELIVKNISCFNEITEKLQNYFDVEILTFKRDTSLYKKSCERHLLRVINNTNISYYLEYFNFPKIDDYPLIYDKLMNGMQHYVNSFNENLTRVKAVINSIKYEDDCSVRALMHYVNLCTELDLTQHIQNNCETPYRHNVDPHDDDKYNEYTKYLKNNNVFLSMNDYFKDL